MHNVPYRQRYPVNAYRQITDLPVENSQIPISASRCRCSTAARPTVSEV